MRYFFYFLLIYSSCYSQTLKILDAATQKPIPFATVLLKQEDKIVYGTYCSDNGEVIIAANKEYSFASFSCVGYKDKTIQKSLLAEIIYLEPEVYSLDEVVLTGKKLKDTLIGAFENRRETYTEIDTKHQYAYFFENTFKGRAVIKSFVFKVATVRYKTALRIHILKKIDCKWGYKIKGDTTQYFYDSFIPDNDLLNENIIVYINPQKKGTVEVDLSTYNFEIPAEGIFVGIECLAFYDDEGKELNTTESRTEIAFHETVTDNYGKKISLVNSFWVNHNKWVKKDFELVFKTLPGKKSLIAPSFGLKVLNYKEQ